MLKGVMFGEKAVVCLGKGELEQDVMENPARSPLFEQATHPV